MRAFFRRLFPAVLFAQGKLPALLTSGSLQAALAYLCRHVSVALCCSADLPRATRVVGDSTEAGHSGSD